MEAEGTLVGVQVILSFFLIEDLTSRMIISKRSNSPIPVIMVMALTIKIRVVSWRYDV
jgi:hypothetical protein